MYLIDGYNLLHQTEFTERDELLFALDRFFTVLDKRALVVFDGYAEASAGLWSRLEVVFGGDADAELKNIISARGGGGDILVSSDREIRAVARSRKLKMIKAEDFDFSLPARPDKEKPVAFLSDEEVCRQLREYGWRDAKD